MGDMRIAIFGGRPGSKIPFEYLNLDGRIDCIEVYFNQV
jgi:hypothetical protein